MSGECSKCWSPDAAAAHCRADDGVGAQAIVNLEENAPVGSPLCACARRAWHLVRPGGSGGGPGGRWSALQDQRR